MNIKFALTLLASTSLLLTSACTPVGLAVGAGASAGIASAKEGGVRGAITDTAIKARINDLWFKRDVDMFTKLSLTVENGRVLITGVVQSPEEKLEAVKLAWQARGVKQIINEIQVDQPKTIGAYANDTWIASQLRTRLILDPDIQSINYSIDTVKGIVYLMGVAQSQDELNRVVRVARKIKGVKQVVSYVKMSGEVIIPSKRPDQNTNETTPTPLISSREEQMESAPIIPRSESIQTETLSP
jgi:osmotically-inducible protein OsmY